MNIEKKAAELFSLDDETRMEHSNPWSVYSRTFVFPFVWGLWELHLWATVTGILFQILSKYWFLDRMVWLFEDMKQHEEYASWLY